MECQFNVQLCPYDLLVKCVSELKKNNNIPDKTLLAMYEKNILTELTSFEQGTIFTTETSNIQIILKFDLKQNINNNNTH